ncbi:FixH family protein [Actinokineospora diospyrosa]|uniref:YtkA-like n=1 Tax=Actinokineospora diospyrosa TaxID=103728 RepID=A0ABT1IF40_9PSEU|nr:FixH family protein [Actinokineospora diospyrosa]MCP2271270.1 YtkA-like [Actinokineospora diospyrosa]
MTRLGKSVLTVVVALLAGALIIWWVAPGDDTVDLHAGTTSYSVRLSVTDPAVGTNTVDVEVADLSGTLIAADEVILEPVMVDMGHALTPTALTPTAAKAGQPGHYRAERIDLPMTGPWELTVTIRHRNTTERAVFSLVV